MPAKTDLTGQRFSRLLALHETPERRNGAVVWQCLCDCGNEVSVRNDQLKSGYTKSCGCLKVESAIETGKKKVIDLSGRRFGKLTAIERAECNTRQGSAKWICRCDCGNQHVEVSSDNLQRENTESCGCAIKDTAAKVFRIDLSGQRFGRLVAILPTEKRSGWNVMWQCQCDCGKQVDVASYSLRSGLTRSCGCYGVEVLIQRITTHGLSKTSEYARAAQHQRRSLKRNNGGKHSAKDILNLFVLQKYRCGICRCAISKQTGHYHIDHVVPLSAGGSNDRMNLQLLCPNCNLRKSAKDPIVFMQSQGFLL